MLLNGEAWIPDRDKKPLPLPPLPPAGYTYAADGATGDWVKAAPAGMCGLSCPECWEA